MQATCGVEIGGVTYVPQPEKCRDTCEGCIARKDNELCSELQDTCVALGVIFIKKENQMQPQETQAQPEVTPAEEPKYTVEEVLDACGHYGHYYLNNNQVSFIKQYLAKKNNPDYKLYLELKAKFGE